MVDKHLNLFYSYSRDNELIENNLTRAFIVTLSLLTAPARQFVLSTLLAGRTAAELIVSWSTVRPTQTPERYAGVGPIGPILLYWRGLSRPPM